MKHTENRPDLSIIIPAYNEEDRITPTLLQIIDLANQEDIHIELIVVDDGSIDRTGTRILELGTLFEGLTLITHDTNRGKGAAVRTGVLHARGKYIIFTDADFSYPMTRLHEALSGLEKSHMIIGSRIHPESRMVIPPPLYRRIIAYLFNAMVRVMLGLPYADTQCGFKGFRHEIAVNLFKQGRVDGFAFDAEILAMATLFGYRVTEIPVSLVHSYGSRLSLFHDAVRMARDILRIWFYMKWDYYHIQPLENGDVSASE